MRWFQKNKESISSIMLVFVMLCASGIVSYKVYDLRDTWPGLAPAPSESAALFYGYGDRQLSYRNVGMILQNAGDTGGHVTHFSNYNYQTVEDWLWLSDKLDPKANYVPSLAAYYFSAAKDPDKLAHLLDYLAHTGQDTTNERWRFLAHAIYLARFRVEDQEKALAFAEKLANLKGNLPIWTKVMPAYVRKATGDKKEARNLLLLTIADPSAKMEQTDINQNCWYIDENLREPDDGLDTNKVFQDFCAQYIKSIK